MCVLCEPASKEHQAVYGQPATILVKYTGKAPVTSNWQAYYFKGLKENFWIGRNSVYQHQAYDRFLLRKN